MLFVGTIYVLTLIQDVFEHVGSSMKLPDITLWFMDFVDIIMAYWYVPVIIIAAIAAGIFWYINTPRGRYNLTILNIRCQYSVH